MCYPANTNDLPCDQDGSESHDCGDISVYISIYQYSCFLGICKDEICLDGEVGGEETVEAGFSGVQSQISTALMHGDQHAVS